jgi:hypothetical protein
MIYCYGGAASPEIARQIAEDISRYWNEPEIMVRGLRVWFDIQGFYSPDLAPEEVWFNDDPAKNFFRIEAYSAMDISFVDGLGSNTGYFKLANLQHTGTTAAHEFGHTLGLDHPEDLDIRGQGKPGIMYPRGTIVDAEFQYNPAAQAGDGPMGGTMDASKRVVTAADIGALRLDRKLRNASRLPIVLGDFSSIYHQAHG